MNDIKTFRGKDLLKNLAAVVIILVVLTCTIWFFSGDNLQGTDFYIYYQAQRAVFLEQTNPYSDHVAEVVQMAVYKHLAGPLEDQLGFAYPPYSLLVHLPTVGMTFAWAQAFWLAFNLVALTLGVFLAYPQASRKVFLFIGFIFPFAFALLLGNYDIAIFAVLLVSYAYLTREGKLSKGVAFLLGFLLSWATVKPQFSWLFVIFFLLIALRKKQWRFIAGFFIGMGFMLLSSFIMVPNWPLLWYERLVKYRVYNQTWIMVTFFLREFLPEVLADRLSMVVLAVCLGFTAWLLLQWWRGRCPDLLALAWCGTMIFLIHPRGRSYEQIVYILPLIVWVCQQGKVRSFAGQFFWWGTFAVSWGVFLLDRVAPDFNTVLEWPLFFHFIWLGWLFYQHRDEVFQKPRGINS